MALHFTAYSTVMKLCFRYFRAHTITEVNLFQKLYILFQQLAALQHGMKGIEFVSELFKK